MENEFSEPTEPFINVKNENILVKREEVKFPGRIPCMIKICCYCCISKYLYLSEEEVL